MGHNLGGEGLDPTPELHEPLRINNIVIPADNEQPLRQGELAAASIEDYQALVGGSVEAIPLGQPPARLYCNEEGKLIDLPVNRRATMLLWMHNRAFRGQDAIVGDVFLVGDTKRSLDTSVPDEYVKLLFEPHTFSVDVRQQGNEQWSRNRPRFDDWVEAYAYALTLIRDWPAIEDIRVVPEQ
jgi:hypothetical protein